MSTGISWTDETWNPVRGCSRVSEGCRHCYAEQMAARIVRMGNGKPTPYDGLVRIAKIPATADSVLTPAEDPNWVESPSGDVRPFALGTEARWTGKVVFDPVKLATPIHWRSPRRIFVNSMSDLFHERLTNEQIAAIFGVMAVCPHTFQILTKRAKRMREWFAWAAADRGCGADMFVQQCARSAGVDVPLHKIKGTYKAYPWPLTNVWIGVSVEHQDAADERIPDLLRTPAAVRFLSCEPLLGEVTLLRWFDPSGACCGSFESCPDGGTTRCPTNAGWRHTAPDGTDPRIDWVIAGCESGPVARPCDVAWLRSLRDQCSAAGVAYFLKQAVSRWVMGGRGDQPSLVHAIQHGLGSTRKPNGVIDLPYLDGVQHAAFPSTVKP